MGLEYATAAVIAAGLIKFRSGRGPLHWIRRMTIHLEAACLWFRDRIEEAWTRRDRYFEVVRDVEAGRR